MAFENTSFPFFPSMLENNSMFKNSNLGRHWEVARNESTKLEGEKATSNELKFEPSFFIRDSIDDLMFLRSAAGPGRYDVQVYMLVKDANEMPLLKGKISNSLTGDGILNYNNIAPSFFDVLPDVNVLSHVVYYQSITKDQIIAKIAERIGIDPTVDPNDVMSAIKNAVDETCTKEVLDAMFNFADPNAFEILLEYLRESLLQFWIPFFEFLAQKIESAKIQDSNKWLPFLANGEYNNSYNPIIPADSIGLGIANLKSYFSDLNARVNTKIDNIENSNQVFGELSLDDVMKRTLEGFVENAYDNITDIIKPVYDVIIGLLEEFADFAYSVNAFLVGLYNGILQFVADIMRLVSFIGQWMAEGDKIISAIGQWFKSIKFVEALKQIFSLIKQLVGRYWNAQDAYDRLKKLGEDLIYILEAIFIAGVVVKFAKLSASAMRKIASRIGKEVDDLKKPLNFDDALQQATEEFAIEMSGGSVADFAEISQVFGEQFVNDLNQLGVTIGISQVPAANTSRKIYELYYKGQRIFEGDVDSVIRFTDNLPSSNLGKHLNDIVNGKVYFSPRGSVARNKLHLHEFQQAKEVVEFKGGRFDGQIQGNTPGIDGHLDGKPVSLKEYNGSSSQGVLRHVSKAEDQLRKAAIGDVDVYVNAKNVNLDNIIDFSLNGPLKLIPSQGFVDNIFIQTSDGWIVINKSGISKIK